MTDQEWAEACKTAIHLKRSGVPTSEIAGQLQRSVSWVNKWWGCYQQAGWAGLSSRSRTPQHCPTQLSLVVKQAICQARSELEVEAAQGDRLRYVGPEAVRGRLVAKKVKPLPSTASITRVLRTAGMSQPKARPGVEEVQYPHLQPSQPGQLCQVDIVPHYLQGGQAIACFNAIDVVSRYPTGQASTQRRAQDAARFLVHVWQIIGRSQYTQVDNEGCFSGGFTHPGVLGTVVRLALAVGTELVFSPFYHPESNGFVERFHQDYNQHVWAETSLVDRADVQNHADPFFNAYRHSPHHSALHGQCPADVHLRSTQPKLAPDFQLTPDKLPLTAGRMHFIRQVNPDKTISVFNMTWPVPAAQPRQGVWATLELQTSGATLRVYDHAPDVPTRRCLVEHPFPLREPILPHPAPLPSATVPDWLVALLVGTVTRLAQARACLATMF